jgi:para-nitrobenzyl esterase
MSDTEVSTQAGPIRGTQTDAAAIFRGIPYAAARRFAAPEPPEPWTATRDARTAGPAAPQGRSMLAPILGDETVLASEDDCLTLNVFTPGLTGRLPVLLWLHGGAFVTGYAGGPRQSGAQLAARGDIVVVTANYRLGPLGYLYLNDGGGNLGLLDQIAALRWVHDNVAAFGGDPDLVTVAGHSAGALSAAAVAVSPNAAGLARRVMLASPQLGSVTTPERAEREAQQFLDRLGGYPLAVSAEQLIKTADELAAERGPAGVAPSLVVGGAGLPRDISAALADSDLGLVIGTTRDEARAFLVCDPGVGSVDRAMATGMLGQHLPGRGDEVYRHYAARRPGASPAEVATDALTDALFRMPALKLAEARGAYVYQFDWQASPEFGACHTVDLPFTLGNPAAWSDTPLLAGRDVAALQPLADTYSDALVSFVRTGAAPWNHYDATRRTTMRFDSIVGPIDDLAGPERELWNRP